ncbi:hypothetical protein GCM10010988_21860 [Cnuibacter physcomitrellae]|uniref:hypothetical protein n=1 Tax=Cnuibacter physcomitrellae TaxID=1619308 RepID=UPI0012F487C4|nr:hypothetical protein [Cnuibacter physcomitrellae]MCS5497767.1 hypothetical protein [Cnuibacter physcomitrellae]GGI38996.1 hypothetical protein GCM10010988_21860 [Cnuibacter physcomitrellae]
MSTSRTAVSPADGEAVSTRPTRRALSLDAIVLGSAALATVGVTVTSLATLGIR